MAIISCPECGKQISDRAVSCPDCGCPINAAPVAAAATVDVSKEVEQLLVLARRAKESSDSTNAKKYYDQILMKDPGNWEAIFYSVYYEAMQCKIRDISSAAYSVANSIRSTFLAIADLKDEAAEKDAIDTVISSAIGIAGMFISSAQSHYNEFSTTSGAGSELTDRKNAAGRILYEIEYNLMKIFPKFRDELVSFQLQYVKFIKSYSVNQDSLERLNNEIGAARPEYAKMVALEKKKEGLRYQISALNSQMNSLVTERKAIAKGCGFFFLPIGIFMIICSMAVGSELWWGYLVGAIEIAIAIPCFTPSPSQEVVNANLKKKEELRAERDKLQKALDSLN